MEYITSGDVIEYLPVEEFPLILWPRPGDFEPIDQSAYFLDARAPIEEPATMDEEFEPNEEPLRPRSRRGKFGQSQHKNASCTSCLLTPPCEGLISQWTGNGREGGFFLKTCDTQEKEPLIRPKSESDLSSYKGERLEADLLDLSFGGTSPVSSTPISHSLDKIIHSNYSIFRRLNRAESKVHQLEDKQEMFITSFVNCVTCSKLR
ncbi:hypothetical protein HDE_02793 [Halotydeus destructor]|nr:hypothetical protein HDE_02793 [Halotydeus destructor]